MTPTNDSNIECIRPGIEQSSQTTTSANCAVFKTKDEAESKSEFPIKSVYEYDEKGNMTELYQAYWHLNVIDYHGYHPTRWVDKDGEMILERIPNSERSLPGLISDEERIRLEQISNEKYTKFWKLGKIRKRNE